MNTHCSTPHVAYIGLDWADRSHHVCLRAAQSERDEHSTLEHEPRALHAWAQALKTRFPHGRIAVAVEQSKGPLIYALMQHAHLELYPVNPAMLAKYREAAKAASGVKSDALDGTLQCELVRQHRDWLRPLPVVPAETRQLQMLLEARRALVDQRTALVQQLTAALKGYFPQALECVGALDTPLSWAFLQRWPTLAAVQRARPATLERFYRAHGVHGPETIAERLKVVRTAVALTDDPAVLAAYPLQVAACVAQLTALHAPIAEYHRRIAALFARQLDARLFAALPGAGEQLAPRLYVAFGPDRGRYDQAESLQRYSGVAPVKKQSGRTCLTQWRWHCPKFLRQTFHEFAGCSIPHSLWAKAYYEQQRAAGKSEHKAKRALAFKWQRVLFRCWKDHQPYDEQKYIAALRRRGSPLVARIDALAAAA
jgi:transposase